MALTQVSSAGIKNAEVKTEDILDANVTTAKVADNAITGAKIADDAVDGDKLADNITLAGTLTIPDTITHTGDTNTKIRFPAADTVSVEAGGFEKLRIEGDYTGTVDVKGHPAHFRLNSLRDTSDWDATDPIGKIDFYISGDTTNNLPYNAAFIHCLNETNNADEPSGALVFGTTTANASGGAVERFRIDQNGNVSIPNDSGKFLAGAGNDLQIYHDGSHSYISNNTGNLNIYGDVIQLRSSGDEYYLKGTANGSVELYYDNAKKFETTSVGAQITGRLVLDGGYLHISGSDLYIDDSRKAYFGAGSDLQILHSGSYSMIKQTNAGTGDLYIDAEGSKSILIRSGDGSSGAEAAIVCNANAATELYHSGTKKLETASYGASVTGNLGVNTTSPTVGYGGDVGIHIHSTATTGSRGSSIHLTSGTSGTTAADGSRINTSDNDLVIQNMENARLDLGTNGTHRITIRGDGDVGINNDNPSTKLDVTGNIRASTGILFGTDTATANALDDYEEGDYTPTDNSGASLSFTTNNTGKYTKIGRLVTCHFDITFPTTSNTSVAHVSIPFTSTTYYGGGVSNFNGFTHPAFVHVSGNSAYIMDNDSSRGHSSAHMLNSECSAKRIACNFWYYT